MLKCLCGNEISMSNAKITDKGDVFAGNSTIIVGKTFIFEVTCSKCKKELEIELSITAKNWMNVID